MTLFHSTFAIQLNGTDLILCNSQLMNRSGKNVLSDQLDIKW